MPLLIVLVAGTTYVLTLLPGIGISGDAAKFQFVGRYLGTPHATGYPTYILLSHFFTRFLPIGSIAYRANLLSAVFATSALAVVYRILRELDVDEVISAAATLILAFSATLWLHSLFAEVYTLHLLFTVSTCYFFVRWNRTGQDRYLVLACAAYAFSFGNHLTAIVMLPAIAFLVWVTDRFAMLRKPKLMAVILALILLSLSQYAYFYWRTNDPSTVYLEMNARNLRTLVWFMTGGQFRAGFFGYSPQEFIAEQIPKTMGLFASNFGILLAAVPMGIFALRQWKVNAFFLLILLGNTFYAMNYRIPDIEAYFIPSYLFVAIYIGLGLQWLLERLQPQVRRGIRFAALIGPIALLSLNYSSVDQHQNFAKANETQAILRSISEPAILVAPDYDVFEYLMYYVIAEGWDEKDIFVTNHFDIDGLTSYARGEALLENSLTRKRALPGSAVYLTGIRAGEIGMLEERGFSIEPIRSGILYRAVLQEAGEAAMGLPDRESLIGAWWSGRS